jgi:hypothetical protein
MLSYHNDVAIKLKYKERFDAHRKADEVVQGTGFDGRRGCFVGCTLDSYDHSRFPIELGWPEWLARLADSIFEEIPEKDAAQFGTDLLEAVPVGVDLEPVRWKLAILRHERQLDQLKDNKQEYAEKVRKALDLVIDYYKSQVAGTACEQQRIAAQTAAKSAAKSAESAGVWSVARSALWSAAPSWSTFTVADSARDASWSTSWTKSDAWIWERDTLLSIIRNLK